MYAGLQQFSTKLQLDPYENIFASAKPVDVERNEGGMRLAGLKTYFSIRLKGMFFANAETARALS